MQSSADPLTQEGREAALDAMTRAFYGGDLAAACQIGAGLLAAIDPDTPDRAAQTVRALAAHWLIRCARRTDELDIALTHAYTGIAASRAAGDGSLECRLRAQLVHLLCNFGQNESALDEAYKVLRQAVDLGDSLALATCWLALGQVHWSMQQWKDSEQAYQEALSFATAGGHDELLGFASNGLAAMEDRCATEARAAMRVDEANAHARRSLDLLEVFTRISQESGDAYNASVGKNNQACGLFAMGDYDAARELLDTQLKLLDGEQGCRYQVILQLLGDIHLAEGRHGEAIACQTEALAVAERLRLPLLALAACGSLVTALERSGDLQAALDQHRRYHTLYVQLASNKAQAHARAMAVVHETATTRALADAERQRADRLASANISLVEEKAVLQRTSMEDALTGLANRRRFDQALERVLLDPSSKTTHALAMLDVDHFKRVNDRFSHLVGDEVLRRLGALMQRCCRKHDMAARFGGEEFAVILADVDRPAAHAACERLRAAVETEPWSTVHPELRVTVSIGLVHAEEAEDLFEPHGLLAIADTRLYAAKHAGRNRVVSDAG